jgi:hypothetical protein
MGVWHSGKKYYGHKLSLEPRERSRKQVRKAGQLHQRAPLSRDADFSQEVMMTHDTVGQVP